MRISPWRLLLLCLKKSPKTAGLSVVLDKLGKVVDKKADKARVDRKNLVDEIRRGGTLMVIALMLAGAGCATSSRMAGEGYDLSLWQKAKLGWYDLWVGADNAKDYELVIGEAK